MTLSKKKCNFLARWLLRTIGFMAVSTVTLTVLVTIALVLALNDASVVIIKEKGLSVVQEMLTYTALTAFFISGIAWGMTIIFTVIKTAPKSPAIHSYE